MEELIELLGEEDIDELGELETDADGEEDSDADGDEETDAETDSVKITIEGGNIDYNAVKKEISVCGAVIHSIDGVSAGIKIIDAVNTPQDR